MICKKFDSSFGNDVIEIPGAMVIGYDREAQKCSIIFGKMIALRMEFPDGTVFEYPPRAHSDGLSGYCPSPKRQDK